MRTLLILLLGLALSACERPITPKEEILLPSSVSKELVIVTHNGPNTYYVNGEGEHAGLEYDLAMLFAKYLGPDYQVKFLVVDNISKVIPTLMSGKAHIAAADLSVTPIRSRLVNFTKPYQEVQQYVVYNKQQNDAPKNVRDLTQKLIMVPAGTSYAERLRELQQQNPSLNWQEPKNSSADELLEQVASGTIDYTVADDHLIDLLVNYYPNLGKGMALGQPEKVAWAMPQRGEPELYKKANAFFAEIKKDGTLRNLIDRYYGHTERLDNMDVTAFLSRSQQILPKYVSLFKEAQEQTNLDWRLIAAISYQESHWDRLNTSPTNVRGMMMLTESTADKMGVSDRLDARQSIMGGAKYINLLKEMVPKRIAEPDRTWLTLAAYNIGYAHVEDARVLAQRLKLNPDSWADLKKTLPLLNKAEYYSTLKYGYASGGAPVVFVESIRTYQKILERYQPKHQSVLPDFNLVEEGNDPSIHTALVQ